MSSFASKASLVLIVPVIAAALACSLDRTALKGEFIPAPKASIVVGPKPGRPVVGDFDRDGNLDIAVTCGAEDLESRRLIILAGNGKGEFTKAGEPISIAASANKVAIGDMSGDGILDAVVAEHDSYAITVLLGDGKTGFKPVPGSPFHSFEGSKPHTHEVALADVNGDGKLDVLATLANDHAVAILLGDGSGALKPALGSPFVIADHPYDAISISDINHDGKQDLIVPDLDGNSICIALAEPNGGFSREHTTVVKVGARPGYLATADLNGDGKLDICASHDDEATIDLLAGNGKGEFHPLPNSPLRPEVKGFVWGVVARDMNGDNKADLVLAAVGADAVAVMFGDGRGGFKPAIGSPFRVGKEPDYVAIGDYDNDGRPDIAAANEGGSSLSILLNRSPLPRR